MGNQMALVRVHSVEVTRKCNTGSLPPDLTSPTKCAADYPYNGLLGVTGERAVARLLLQQATVISKLGFQ